MDYGLTCYVMDSCGPGEAKGGYGNSSRPDARKGVLNAQHPMSPHGRIDFGLTRPRELKVLGWDERHSQSEARLCHSLEDLVQRLSMGTHKTFLGKTAAAASPGKAMASLIAAETTIRRTLPCSHLLNRKDIRDSHDSSAIAKALGAYATACQLPPGKRQPKYAR